MIDKGYFTTSEVMKMTGLSKARCLQYARSHDIQKVLSCFGNVWWYGWNEKDIEALTQRKGKRGDKYHNNSFT